MNYKMKSNIVQLNLKQELIDYFPISKNMSPMAFNVSWDSLFLDY